MVRKDRATDDAYLPERQQACLEVGNCFALSTTKDVLDICMQGSVLVLLRLEFKHTAHGEDGLRCNTYACYKCVDEVLCIIVSE